MSQLNRASVLSDNVPLRQPPGEKDVVVVEEVAERRTHDDHGRKILTEEDAYERLGFRFSTRKKWLILTCIFLVQISMNFNAAIYASAVPGMTGHFAIEGKTARLGQMVFLVAYAFGCELWAPWSEELGRKWVLQGSLFLVNLWQIPCALAPNFWTVSGFRLLGGLSSAGGSVTLGMVADMWEPAYQQYAVAYVVLSSCAGSVVAPIAGGFITEYLDWPWVFWISLIFGAVVQAIHLFVPETRADILLDKEAKRRRAIGEHVCGPNEAKGNFWQRVSFRESVSLMWRPYKFLLKEPIVTCLSLLSGFSDALIFTGLDSFGPVLDKWDFSVVQKGLAFIPLLVGYFIAYALFLPVYRRDRRQMNGDADAIRPEQRLQLLLWLAPLEFIGLLDFGFCSLGPPVHWIAPLFFTCLIGIANFAIYMATIDYMVAAYGPYAASATGGNGFCRDLLAGIAAVYATPLYENIVHGTNWQLVIPTEILAGISIPIILPIYVFYVWGEWFRARSPYAQTLSSKRGERKEARAEAISRAASPAQSRANSISAGAQARRVSEMRGFGSVPVSRSNSLRGGHKRSDLEAVVPARSFSVSHR